jgi:hypothetical protein
MSDNSSQSAALTSKIQLIEALHNAAYAGSCGFAEIAQSTLFWKAADEIERLRAALEKIAKWYPSKMSPAGDLAREVLRPADETTPAP